MPLQNLIAQVDVSLIPDETVTLVNGVDYLIQEQGRFEQPFFITPDNPTMIGIDTSVVPNPSKTQIVLKNHGKLPASARFLIWRLHTFLGFTREPGVFWKGGSGMMDPDLLRYTAAGVAVRDVVYLSAPDTVSPADAFSGATIPAIGFVNNIAGPFAFVQDEGEVPGFVGLTPGAEYFVKVGDPGKIVKPGDPGYPLKDQTPQQVLQKVGEAKNATTLIVEIEESPTFV